ncbi:hypothetical protein K378_04649 [Streptomyces sp. Amel2xB2]|uniref:Uncharacterized protein n=1 Tax=Streptomyces nanshensis TaxID=518642 RepID=A0A1E7LAA3_9ACTN|nr:MULTISPECIES: hypothetical protein [Streptomyces]OEV13084.1 hypothetical protein AN218_05280 [Streptomyces nanshensis]RAJ59952.1 hypothetical protein K378_04649 [Streptomyces sp. Amel2xB2]
MAVIKVGRPQVRPDKAAHVPGVRQGNHQGAYGRQPGHLPDDTSTARRSTGISAKGKGPIVPGMPNLSPA